MGLETFSGIWTLNSAWPLGASDLKSQGDDHIRGLKAAILATFPNVAGAVTVTHTALNAIQSAANLTSGTLADARVAQSNVTQHEAALGSATNVSSTIARRDGSGDLHLRLVRGEHATDDSSAVNEIIYRVAGGSGTDNYFRSATIARVLRQMMLSGAVTLQSDPGGTPSGSPGQIFAYY